MNKVVFTTMMASVMAFSLTASASLVDISNDYNVFVSGDFTAKNDAVHGRAAVKGNVTITGEGGYSFGQDASDEFILVSGGDVNLNASGSVFNGGIYSDGKVTNNGFTIHGNVVAKSYTGNSGGFVNGYGFASNDNRVSPVKFDQVINELKTASETYYGMTETGKVDNSYNTVTLTGTHTEGLTVFNLKESDIENMHTLIIDIAENEHAVINVAGKDIKTNKNGFGVKKDKDHDFKLFGNVLFNFYEAEDIALQTSFAGSILAMDADVIVSNPYNPYFGGEMHGDLFAKSFTGKMEFHDYSFNPPEPPSVPEPSTVSFLLTGLLGLVPLIRRKIRK